MISLHFQDTLKPKSLSNPPLQNQDVIYLIIPPFQREWKKPKTLLSLRISDVNNLTFLIPRVLELPFYLIEHISLLSLLWNLPPSPTGKVRSRWRSLSSELLKRTSKIPALHFVEVDKSPFRGFEEGVNFSVNQFLGCWLEQGDEDPWIAKVKPVSSRWTVAPIRPTMEVLALIHILFLPGCLYVFILQKAWREMCSRR